MFPIRTKNRRGITAVLTTVIILVASIVLGTSVAVYSTNLFQTGGQQQSVQLLGAKTWVNGTYSSGAGGPGGGIGWGAFSVKNTGDKILSVNSITIRGAAIPFDHWYVDADSTRVNQNFQAQFNYTTNDMFGNIKGTQYSGGGPAGLGVVQGADTASCTQSLSNPPTMIVVQVMPKATNSPLCLKQQSGPAALNPGQSAILYYKMPVSLLAPTDAGVTSTISVLAGNAPVSQTIRIANP
jgi:hypothetical protein